MWSHYPCTQESSVAETWIKNSFLKCYARAQLFSNEISASLTCDQFSVASRFEKQKLKSAKSQCCSQQT